MQEILPCEDEGPHLLPAWRSTNQRLHGPTHRRSKRSGECRTPCRIVVVRWSWKACCSREQEKSASADPTDARIDS